MAYTKEDAIRIVVSCAQVFENELANRTLLLILSDKQKRISCVEFAFCGYHYLHLTGLKLLRKDSSANSPDITAAMFYEKCLSHKLSPRDFAFAEDGTTTLKLDVLPYIINKNLSARMVGDYDSLKPRLYTEKLAGGVKGCIGFVASQNGAFVPNTILKEDIRNYSRNTLRVLAVLRKETDAEKYAELTYLAKGINLDLIELPHEYDYLKHPDKDE